MITVRECGQLALALGWTKLREANRRWYGIDPDGNRASFGEWFSKVDDLALLGLKKGEELIKEKGLPLEGLFFESTVTLEEVTASFEAMSYDSIESPIFWGQASSKIPGAETAATARAIINMAWELTK